MMRNTEKRAKVETNTIGPGIWQETVEKFKYEKYTLQDLDYGKKTEKRGK